MQVIKFVLLRDHSLAYARHFAINGFHATKKFIKVLLGPLNVLILFTNLAQFCLNLSFHEDELLVMEDDILLVLFNSRLS